MESHTRMISQLSSQMTAALNEDDDDPLLGRQVQVSIVDGAQEFCRMLLGSSSSALAAGSTSRLRQFQHVP